MIGHDCIEADIVPEKTLRVLDTDIQATGSELSTTLMIV